MASKRSKRAVKRSTSSSHKVSRSIPPRKDELELSLFGPGIGECIVVHLGAGNWMVVDSCLNQSGEKAIALEYLERLGVEVERQVKLIVVTHWHDDHIRGISQIVQAASSAQIACSAALRTVEFFTLIAANKEINLVEHTSGVSELADMLSIIDARSDGRYACGPDYWATEGQRLYRDSGLDEIEVHALSPSGQTVTDAMGGIARIIPAAGESIRRFPCQTPNDLSVVLLVKTKGIHLLLGADLETGRDEKRGWQAVLRSGVRPAVKSSGYKVAHHGSENGDVEGIWTELVVKDARALVTPYARGRRPLPTNDDIRRIKAKTQHVYCTVWPPTRSPPGRNVDRTMKEVATVRRAVSKRSGHIRLRGPLAGNLAAFNVDVFDGAKRL